MAEMTTGPLEFSAPKLEVSTFISCGHVGDGVDSLTAIAAGIDDVRAVRRDVERAGTQTVRREASDRTGACALLLGLIAAGSRRWCR